MNFVKEIYVDGALNETLRFQEGSSRSPWMTSKDSAQILFVFEQVVQVSSIRLQFWVLSYSDEITVHLEIPSGIKHEWKSVFTLNVAGEPPALNRVVDISGPLEPATGLRIDLRGGHPDPFYQRYRIGLKHLSLDARASKVPDPETSTTTDIKQPSYEGTALKGDRKRRAPLYAFPDAAVVLKAVDQTERSPWRILTAKSRHKEKLEGRSMNNKDLGMHLLPRFTTPSKWTIPSSADIHSLKRKCM